MRLSHQIQYYGLLLVARIICLVPRTWAMHIGVMLGSFGWALGIRRDLVLSNIAVAQPEASPAELKRIGKQAAKNFGRTAAEFIRYGVKDRDKVADLVHIEGLTELRRALAEGKGAILLTGHFGAWALYFAAISESGIPLSLLVGKQRNQKVDAFILKIPGDRIEFISKGRAALRKIIANLKDGRAIVMVADQHARTNGIWVPFCGKMASTRLLPGSLAIKHNAPVFLMTGYRLKTGKHRVEIKPLEIPGEMTPDEQKVEVIVRYNEELGKIISAHPEHYFWYHRRWRKQNETGQGK